MSTRGNQRQAHARRLVRFHGGGKAGAARSGPAAGAGSRRERPGHLLQGRDDREGELFARALRRREEAGERTVSCWISTSRTTRRARSPITTTVRFPRGRTCCRWPFAQGRWTRITTETRSRITAWPPRKVRRARSRRVIAGPGVVDGDGFPSVRTSLQGCTPSGFVGTLPRRVMRL